MVRERGGEKEGGWEGGEREEGRRRGNHTTLDNKVTNHVHTTGWPGFAWHYTLPAVTFVKKPVILTNFLKRCGRRLWSV